MGHRRQERAHMSQREQREGHRRQEKLHMSSQLQITLKRNASSATAERLFHF